MMCFLIQYVLHYMIDLRMPIREYTITLLPAKLRSGPSFAIYKFIAFYFYLLDEIRNGYRWFNSNKKMGMIRHTMNGQHFGVSVLNESCYVLMEFFFMFFCNETLSLFYRENKLEIDL